MIRIALVSPARTGKTTEAKSTASKYKSVLVVEPDHDRAKAEWVGYETIPSVKHITSVAEDSLIIIDENVLTFDDAQHLAVVMDKTTTVSVVVCCQHLGAMPMPLRPLLRSCKPNFYEKALQESTDRTVASQTAGQASTS